MKGGSTPQRSSSCQLHCTLIACQRRTLSVTMSMSLARSFVSCGLSFASLTIHSTSTLSSPRMGSLVTYTGLRGGDCYQLASKAKHWLAACAHDYNQ